MFKHSERGKINMLATQRHYIDVPYLQKDQAKELGAKFDWDVKCWYVPDGINKDLFSRWEIIERKTISRDKLSDEQNHFIDLVLDGNNVLVDACIGSGKTTSIQALCREIPDKKILYLTYNMLLKIDAQSKLRQKNILVTNYNGFAYQMLKKKGICVSPSDQIPTFNKLKPNIPHFDLLFIDEYQDINQEMSEMLWYIKECNPDIQIAAVGDMDQKIYDWTTLNVKEFIEEFLDSHINMSFTKCFRLNEEFAARLGRLWKKPIVGVNQKCSIKIISEKEAVSFIAKKDVRDVLCLGARTGGMTRVLNKLETKYPEKFNKNTVYASIKDKDGSTYPTAENAIFTTFDGSKGMERKYCLVFDYTEEYWSVRLKNPDTNPDILKNIFLVAASRGKKEILFVSKKNRAILTDKTIMRADRTNIPGFNRPFTISSMFDFKYKEDVDECFRFLKIKELPVKNHDIIDIPLKDGLIDISPCVGNYQSATYFKNYDIDSILADVENSALYGTGKKREKPLYTGDKELSLEEKLLLITAYETGYNRYFTQVETPFVDKEAKKLIHKRLSSLLSVNEKVEGSCAFTLRSVKGQEFLFEGRWDVCKNNKIFELKFVRELSHEHFLQLACYLYATETEEGILWNIRDNRRYKVSLPADKYSRNAFIATVLRTVTKRKLADKEAYSEVTTRRYRSRPVIYHQIIKEDKE